MTDSKGGAFRLTGLNEKLSVQMKAAERIMREDRAILHELARRGNRPVKIVNDTTVVHATNCAVYLNNREGIHGSKKTNHFCFL